MLAIVGAICVRRCFPGIFIFNSLRVLPYDTGMAMPEIGRVRAVSVGRRGFRARNRVEKQMV